MSMHVSACNAIDELINWGMGFRGLRPVQLGQCIIHAVVARGRQAWPSDPALGQPSLMPAPDVQASQNGVLEISEITGLFYMLILFMGAHDWTCSVD